MKKILSILSLILMFACCNFALTSCSDDDEDENTEDKAIRNIIGTWEYYEADAPNTVRAVTFNTDGTYFYYSKDVVPEPNSTETDKEGYLFKYKGTYTVSNDKLILNSEFAYEPILLKDPNDAEWHKENRTTEATIEWQDGNKVMQLHGVNKDGDAYDEVWKKVK